MLPICIACNVLCRESAAIVEGIHSGKSSIRGAGTMSPLCMSHLPCAPAEQHGALLELLEIPSLMEACVRAGSYDDALDLRAYCAKLALLHADLEVRGTQHVPSPATSLGPPIWLFGLLIGLSHLMMCSAASHCDLCIAGHASGFFLACGLYADIADVRPP